MNMDIENGRIYLPAEDKDKPNDRKVMHPETSADQVIMDAAGTKLSDHLGPQMVVSENNPGKACIWAQITATRV